MTYLDYSATTPLLPAVRQKMLEVMDLELGNASSLHTPGHHANALIEEARTHVARLINADPSEIIFTSGGSEANNTVSHIFAGQNVATSAIEHPSVLESLQARAKTCQLIDVDEQGFVDPIEISNLVHDPEISSVAESPDLVSVMLANNELGSIEQIAEIAKCCKNYNTQRDNHPSKRCKNYNTSATPARPPFLHTDATQALGKIPIDVKELGVDYLTISAHKIGGPVGIGALYVKNGAPYKPLILGGHQESKRRAGTSNTLLAAGFGAAAKFTREQKTVKKYEKIRTLRNQLAERILKEVPYSSLNSPLAVSPDGIISDSPDRPCLPNILSVSFRAAEGESIQLYLDAAGIAVSTGSACAAGDIQPSHVLMATRHDAEVAHSSIRFSLGLETTQSDIDYVMSALPQIVTRLQGISTIKIQEPNQ